MRPWCQVETVEEVINLVRHSSRCPKLPSATGPHQAVATQEEKLESPEPAVFLGWSVGLLAAAPAIRRRRLSAPDRNSRPPHLGANFLASESNGWFIKRQLPLSTSPVPSSKFFTVPQRLHHPYAPSYSAEARIPRALLRTMTSGNKTTGLVEGLPSSMTGYESDSTQLETEDKSICGYLRQDIRGSMFTELQLVILTFCTGMQGEIPRYWPEITEEESH